MSDSNHKTIQSYEDHVQEYIDGTPQEASSVVKDWIDDALSGLPKDARILEFGSAFGRDAAYMQNLGYTVQCTDATKAFVDLLKNKGFDAKVLNAITDEIGGAYDLVFANAVLLHFTRKEVEAVLRKVFSALNDGGRFAFTLKQGEGEEWSENKLGAPRYFCYWVEGQIEKLAKDAGFTDVTINSDKPTANAMWLQIIAEK